MSLSQKWAQAKPKPPNAGDERVALSSKVPDGGEVSNRTSTPVATRSLRSKASSFLRPYIADTTPALPSPVVPLAEDEALQAEMKSNNDQDVLHDENEVQMSQIGSQNSTNDEEDLILTNWGLPESALDFYAKKGVTRMFKWQRDCLRTPGVLTGSNVVFSAPTSAGKTLVADILLMKQVMERKKKVLVILPFVSVTREKMVDLQEMFRDYEIQVGGFMGAHSAIGGFEAMDVAICTIEKANNYLLKLLQEKRLHILGGLIVDELHMLGDSSRGYLLELLLTKVRFVSSSIGHHIQIVGMSATLPNLDLLGKWLDAAVYQTDFRPVPLTEKMKVGEIVYEVKTMNQVDTLPKMSMRNEDVLDTAHVKLLCVKTLAEGNGTLVFYNDRGGTETLAKAIADQIRDMKAGKGCNAKSSELIHKALNEATIEDVLEQLRSCPTKEDKELTWLVTHGVGYHHAGLCIEQREVIEDAFRSGAIKVLVATSTLSSGVNLPARRVIIRSPMAFGTKLMDIMLYKQMIGRAGRMGIDTEGDSILIVKESQRESAEKLIRSDLPPISSCLSLDDDATVNQVPASLQRAILEVIVTGLASTVEDIIEYLSCTLMAASLDDAKSAATKALIAEKVMKYLSEFNFVTSSQNATTQIDEYTPTQLGKGVVASSLSPNDGLKLVKELSDARKGFVLNTDLHMLYHIIPPYIGMRTKISTEAFRNVLLRIFERSEFEYSKDVAVMLGIGPGKLMQLGTNEVPSTSHFEAYKRFYVALALQDIIQEYSMDDVSNKYQIAKGTLQTLQNSAATFAGMVSTLCGKLGWKNLELLISDFHSRLEFGVQRELLDLMRLPTITPLIARKLHKANYESVRLIAHAKVNDLEAILTSELIQFDATTTGKQRRGHNRIWIESLRKALTVQEVAEHLVRDGRELLEADAGAQIDWSSQSSDSSQVGQFKSKKPAKLQVRKKKKKAIMVKRPAKSPAKLISLDALAKIQRSKVDRVRSNSVGEHSVNLDPSLMETEDCIFDEDDDEEVVATAQVAVPVPCAEAAEVAEITESHQDLESQSNQMFKDGQLEPGVPTPLRLTPNKRRLITPSTSERPRRKLKVGRSLDASLQSVMSDVRSELDTSELVSEQFNESGAQGDVSEQSALHSITPTSEVAAVMLASEDALNCLKAQFTVKSRFSILFEEKKVEQSNGRNRIGGTSLESSSVLARGLPFDGGRMVVASVAINFGDEISFVAETLDELEEMVKVLQEVDFVDSTFEVIVFDVKRAYRIFKECFQLSKNVLLKVRWFCLSTAHWMLDPDLPHKSRPRSVKQLILYYCPLFIAMSKKNRKNQNIYDVALMFPLMQQLDDGLDKLELKKPFEAIEVPVSIIFAEIEMVGMGVDKVQLIEAKASLKDIEKSLEQRIRDLAGKENLNVKSPQEISRILYEKLGLLKHVPELVDGKGKLQKHLSTNKKMLEKLKPFHELPGVLIDFRKIGKSLSGSVIPFIDSVMENHRDEDSSRVTFTRVSAEIDRFVATGRIATENPNLLCVPRDATVTIDDKKVAISIRKCFVASPGHVLLSADYSQLELRIMAHFSKDENLLEMLNAGGDIFRTVAAKVYNLEDFSQVTDEQRQTTKAICYAIIYGMGDEALGAKLCVTKEAAREFKDSFYSTFPGLERFIHMVQADCNESGLIRTLSGRVRIIPKTTSRVGLNSMIQGSAADLIKLAMIAIDKVIDERRMSAKLILEMHDELIFEVQSEQFDEVAVVVSSCMANAAETLGEKISVKLPVNVKRGLNWSEMKLVP